MKAPGTLESFPTEAHVEAKAGKDPAFRKSWWS
jgi:hypothetical protein